MRALVLAVLWVLGVAVCYASEPVGGLKLNQHSKPGMAVMFVVSAQAADITREGGTYVLRLSQINPKVLWFADRPYRQAGYVSPQELAERWKTLTQGTMPNAALVRLKESGIKQNNPDSFPIEILNLHSRDGKLYISCRFLKKPIAENTLTEVALFIDGLIWDPGNDKRVPDKVVQLDLK